jgi:hypothetical protein
MVLSGSLVSLSALPVASSPAAWEMALAPGDSWLSFRRVSFPPSAALTLPPTPRSKSSLQLASAWGRTRQQKAYRSLPEQPTLTPQCQLQGRATGLGVTVCVLLPHTPRIGREAPGHTHRAQAGVPSIPGLNWKATHMSPAAPPACPAVLTLIRPDRQLGTPKMPS